MEIFNILDTTVFQYFLFMLLPIIGYAEIHFRFPSLPSRLFKKEPEIIFDLPLRGKKDRPIPLFLFIKDAHHFPVSIEKAEITISHTETGQIKKVVEVLNLPIKESFYARTFQIAPAYFPDTGEYQIVAELIFRNTKNIQRSLHQDNYSQIPHLPFKILISDSFLPKADHWFWGDLHLHSNYTDDQVEFGAPIAETVQAAKTIGMDFIAITDHSYDLDDKTDNYIENDTELKKWDAFKNEISQVQEKEPEFCIIPGEEVSVGNHANKNVHCLILNDSNFYPGSGDSGERLMHNLPTLTLSELLKHKSEDALAIAAHPVTKPPLSQQLILRRGIWDESDCIHPKITALQILNNNNYDSLKNGIILWKKLLLQGHHIGIVAGNDAHGNFNSFRQVSIPFFKMAYRREHLLGQARTAVFAPKYSLNDLLDGLKNHHTIISNGPFAIFELHGKNQVVKIGETFTEKKVDYLKIISISIPDYGAWNELNLYFGSISQNLESKKFTRITIEKLELTLKIPFEEKDVDYIRLEGFTRNGNQRYFCLTNPIWIERR